MLFNKKRKTKGTKLSLASFKKINKKQNDMNGNSLKFFDIYKE